MSALPIWIAPGDAADRVYDVRAEDAAGLGFALLRPRRGGHDNSVTQLAFAKLNPVEPTDASSRTRCGWPTTARDHRLMMAPGVADPVSLERLLTDYDASTSEHQRLLAAVLTVKFDRDRPLHEQFDRLLAFAMMHVALDRRLTSLAVLHAPGDQLASEAPHGHLLMLARVHQASGWQCAHPELAESEHAAWAAEWTRFSKGWQRLRGS